MLLHLSSFIGRLALLCVCDNRIGWSHGLNDGLGIRIWGSGSQALQRIRGLGRSDFVLVTALGGLILGFRLWAGAGSGVCVTRHILPFKRLHRTGCGVKEVGDLHKKLCRFKKILA